MYNLSENDKVISKLIVLLATRKKSLSSSKALPTQGYNLSEYDKVICKLTTVRARTHHKRTKFFALLKLDTYQPQKPPSPSQTSPNLPPKIKVCLKMTKVISKLTTVRARTYLKMTKFNDTTQA